jgi:outer membrane protein OmpA-like peptidoglycan-associated protein
MSSAPVGKCINFRVCAKADRREPIAVAARDANPICPICSEPLLLSTTIVNPRRNAFVAVGIVTLMLIVGVGLALRHYLTSGSIARAAVPAAVAANVPRSASAVTVAAGPGAPAPAREQTRRPSNAHRLDGVLAALPPRSPGAGISADAPSAYADLVRTARKVDVALYFQRGSGSLDDQANSDVSRLASALKADTLRGGKVVVAGFADNTGDPEYSKALSAKRAARVAAKLTAQGVTVSQTLGFGQNAPIGDNATRAGREANRRVEIFIAR